MGTARLFGVDLLRNFAFPYFSRDIAEFWRRWHISLSTWFRDYLYIPLGGSKGGMWIKIRNTFIIFLVSGFWHGANWTFIVWGFLNALYIMPSIIFNSNRNHLDTVAKGNILPNLKELFQMSLTFTLTVFAWIFFRCVDLNHAYHFISRIASSSFFEIPYFPGIGNCATTLVFLMIFLIIEWFGREQKFAIESWALKSPKIIRWSAYCFFILSIFYFSYSSEVNQQFIYFQF